MALNVSGSTTFLRSSSDRVRRSAIEFSVSRSQKAHFNEETTRHTYRSFPSLSRRGPVSRMVFCHLFVFLQLPQHIRAIQGFAPEAQLCGSVTNHITALVSEQIEEGVVYVQIAPVRFRRYRDCQRAF